MKYTEIKGDLFEMSNEYALAHCISADFKLGAGIAKTFRNKYPDMPDIIKKDMNIYPDKVGRCVMYVKDDDRIIFNLITKQFFYNKPTYDTLKHSLMNLRSQLNTEDITKLAIPQIGCGLDKLEWNKVSQIIKDVFAETDVEIVVCKWE